MSIPQEKEKFECVYSYVLLKFKSWYNHAIRLETRMSFFIRSPLFLSNTKVNLNCCVGVKEKRSKQSYRNQDKDFEAEKLQHKNQPQMLY